MKPYAQSVKPLSEFARHKNKRRPLGEYNSCCKDCERENNPQRKKYMKTYLSNPENYKKWRRRKRNNACLAQLV